MGDAHWACHIYCQISDNELYIYVPGIWVFITILGFGGGNNVLYLRIIKSIVKLFVTQIVKKCHKNCQKMSQNVKYCHKN